MEEGIDRIQAAAYAWSHTAAPMLAGTLVTVIGFLPVGFVGAAESKQALIESDLPYIAAQGRKGGSNVAAAIINAILYHLREAA
jgi:precorrin isomerase